MKKLIKRKKILAVSSGLALLLSFAGIRSVQSASAAEFGIPGGLIVAIIGILSNIGVPVDVNTEKDADGVTRLVFNADLANSAQRISVQSSSAGTVEVRDSSGAHAFDIVVDGQGVRCSSRIE